jgi:hypothetical protein
MVGRERRRQAVQQARQQVDVSERRACQTLGQPRATQRYQLPRAQRSRHPTLK